MLGFLKFLTPAFLVKALVGTVVAYGLTWSVALTIKKLKIRKEKAYQSKNYNKRLTLPPAEALKYEIK